MHRFSWIAWAFLLGSLLACSGGNDHASGDRTERIGALGFSMEMPPGRGWQVRKTDTSITLERRDVAGSHTIGSTLIVVQAHSEPFASTMPPESEVASRFLKERSIDFRAREEEGDASYVSTGEITREGKKLYELIYEVLSRRPLDDPAWEDGTWRGQVEIYLYFPRPEGGRRFFSFSIFDTRRARWDVPPDRLRTIDGVIDSFHVEDAILLPLLKGASS
jgi:hypothetical protein